MPVAEPALRMRRTQRERRASTRARIIDATITGLAERGYQATTTRRVAELAGVSPGTLAHHFPSRLDLITSTLEEIGQRLAHDLHSRLVGAPLDGPLRSAAIL